MQSKALLNFILRIPRHAGLTVAMLFLGSVASDANAQEQWSLQRCIDHAFEHNLQIKIAALGEVSADINTQSAFGAFLPNLNGNASHGYNFGRTIDPFTNQFVESSRIQSNSFSLSTGVTLFNGFQNQINLQRAKLSQLSAKANREVTENSVILTIAGAYLNILFQEEFVRVAEINQTATNRQVKRVTELVNAGAAAEADLLDVKAQLAADQASIVTASNALGLAKLNLVQLLQLSASEADTFAVVRPSAADLERNNLPLSPEAAVNHALSAFPEIRQANLNVEDAELALRLARSGSLPRVFASFNLGTGYSGAAQSIDGSPTLEEFTIGTLVFDDVEIPITTEQQTYNFITTPFLDQIERNFNRSLFFSMSMPIFNNFNVKSAREQASVSQLNANYQLQQTQQTLTTNVESAWADARAARQSSDAQEAALIAAEKAFANAETRYESGASAAVDYADARSLLDNARVNTLRAKYDFAFKSRILDFYMGRAISFR
jgi:outer membrane protein